jgi:hypothetical protein
MRASCCNFAKSAAIFQKHDEARFSMSVTSGNYWNLAPGLPLILIDNNMLRESLPTVRTKET